jgi:hypothetical protein
MEVKRLSQKTYLVKIYINWMAITYICGFIIFIIGLLFSNDGILKFGSFSLIIAAILYVLNVVKTLIHQPLIQ